MRLFREQGFAATTIEQITVAAGVAKGTFYNYFRNKEELAIAGVDMEQGQWFNRIDEILAPHEGVEAKLNACFASAFRWMQQHPDLGMLWSVERLRAGRKDPGRWSSLHEAAYRVWKEGQAAGELRTDRPAEAASLDLMGIHLVYTVAWYHTGRTLDVPQMIAAAIHTYLWGALTPHGRQEAHNE